MTHYTVEFDLAQNQAKLAGSAMVFHCHYYNCAVHRSIEQTLGYKAASLFQRSAAKAARPQLAALIKPTESPEQRWLTGLKLFQQLGFGSFDTEAFTPTGGTVVSQSSHYALGWLSQYGLREIPVCQFVEGYLKALVEIVYDLSSEQVRVQEENCMATGETGCRFVVTVTPRTNAQKVGER